MHRYLYAYGNPTVYVDILGFAPVIGYIYDITGFVNGEKVRYIGQAKDIKARVGSSGHKWKKFIRDSRTSIDMTVVEGDLDKDKSNRNSKLSARREALGSVEQRKLDLAELEEKTKGRLINKAKALKEKNIEPYEKRHNVAYSESSFNLKKFGESYSRAKIGIHQAFITREYKNGLLEIKKGAKAIGRKLTSGADLLGLAIAVRDQRSDELYEKSPYFLSDSDGQFMLTHSKSWVFDYEYEKTYVDEEGEIIQKEIIDKDDFNYLLDEAKVLFGYETFFNEFEPGLFRPSIEKNDFQADCTDVEDIGVQSCLF